MLKAYIENEKTLIFTDPDGFRQERPMGGFSLGLLRADLDGLKQYVDELLVRCIDGTEGIEEQKKIEEQLKTKLDEAHPLFRYFYPLNETALRRCLHKRLRKLCTGRPALMEFSEFLEIYNRIPFKLNHAYLEDYFRKLQYAQIKKYYAEHVQHDAVLTQQLQIEATYLTEKTRSLDKFLSENPDFPEDVLETLCDVAERLEERLQAVFDVEYEPVNALPVEKRYFLDNLLQQKQSVFGFDNYSTSYSMAVTGKVAEKFKAAQLPEDYVRILSECPLNRIEELPVYNFQEVLEVEVRGMLQNGMRLKRCRNCGHYFVPASRVDEIYCGEAYEEGKTCRQAGYEGRESSDELLKAYRTAYKTQHAKMQRKRNKPDYRETVFLPWVKSAKEQLRRVQKSEISEEEFLQWLESNRKTAG